MITCDVCIGGGFDDYNEFYKATTVRSRRVHKCCECGEQINRGDEYERTTLKYQGEIHRYRTCSLCREIREVFTCGKGFLFECLWDDMKEYAFENLTTASPCFAQLGSAAKAEVLRRWRKWKGLAA